MAESVDLDKTEHTYKRRAAALPSRARAEKRVADPQWPATFSEGLLAAGNLLHYILKDTVAGARRSPATRRRVGRHPRRRLGRADSGEPGRVP